MPWHNWLSPDINVELWFHNWKLFFMKLWNVLHDWWSCSIVEVHFQKWKLFSEMVLDLKSMHITSITENYFYDIMLDSKFTMCSIATHVEEVVQCKLHKTYFSTFKIWVFLWITVLFKRFIHKYRAHFSVNYSSLYAVYKPWLKLSLLFCFMSVFHVKKQSKYSIIS